METQALAPTTPTSSKGVFIALEGLANDHAELVKRLHAELVAANLPVKLLPPASQGDVTAQTLSVMLSDSRYPKTPRIRSLLDSTTLASQYETVRAATTTGLHCLGGRGSLTHLVTGYYGLGVSDDYHAMSSLVSFATGKQSPTLTLVFDTPVDELTPQTLQSLALPVPADQQSSFLERVRAGYLWEANQHDFPVIFATSDTNAVFAQVWNHVAGLLKLSAGNNTAGKPSSVAEVLAARPPQKTAPAEPPLAPPPTLGAAKPEPKATISQPAEKPQSNTGNSTEAAPTPTRTQTVSSLLLASLQPSPAAATSEAFDQKDANGHYRYYIPAELKGKVRSQYIRTMNQLFESYSTAKSAVQAHLEKSGDTKAAGNAANILQAMLPLAATFDVQLPTGAKLAAPRDAYAEAVELGIVAPQDTPPESGIQSLADKLLPPNYTPAGQAVRLIRYMPRNELDLATDVVYPHSDLPYDTLEETVSAWPYEQKVTALGAGLQTARGEVLANAQYSFDITGPFASINTLQKQGLPTVATHQLYTPRLGYDIPKVVEDAGAADVYEQCFDLSLELHSAVYAAKGPALAQYAVLHGHNVRSKLTLQASGLLQLLVSAQQADPVHSRLVHDLYEQVTEVHPLLAGNLQSAAQAS